MKFHKEGIATLIAAIIFSFVIILLARMTSLEGLMILAYAISAFVLIIVLQFFRSPNRDLAETNDGVIYAPADGKVVVLEESLEDEVLKDKRIQVSIFMSPLNVHVNRYPINGTVEYSKLHKGKYLVAWHPKSSTENERTTICIKNKHGKVLMRQIAGALARRIVNYAKVADKAVQGEQMGFIKFGSRVDLYLPLGSELLVKIDQKVEANRTIIARFSK